MSDFAQKALDEGYSLDQIKEFARKNPAVMQELRTFFANTPQFKTAKSYGHTDEEQFAHLGLNPYSDTVTGPTGGLASVGKGGTAGQLPKVIGGFRAVGAALLPESAKEESLKGKTPGEAYTEGRDQFAAAQGEYTKQNPIQAGIGETLGAVAASAPLAGAAGAGIRAGASALGRAAGMADAGAGVGNLLTGQVSQSAPLAAKVVGRASRGAIEGASGAAVGDDGDLSGVPTGAGVGAAIGVAPVIGQATAKGVGRLFAGQVDPARAALVDRLANMGVEVPGPEIIQSPSLRGASTALKYIPGSGQVGSQMRQRQQYTSALAKTFGSDADEITPLSINNARDAIGKKLDDFASKTGFTFERETLQDFDNMKDKMKMEGLKPESISSINTGVMKVLDAASKGNGVISGKDYLNLTQRGGPIAQMTASDNPEVRHYGGEIKDILYKNLQEFKLPGSSTEVPDIKLLRNQYKNTFVAAKLLKDAGVEGQINPSQLYNAVESRYGNRADWGKAGIPPELEALALGGQEFYKTPLDVSHRFGQHIPLGVGALGLAGASEAGELLGMGEHLPGGHFLPYAIGAGMGAGRLAQTALNSRTLRNTLIGRYENMGPTNAAAARAGGLFAGQQGGQDDEEQK